MWITRRAARPVCGCTFFLLALIVTYALTADISAQNFGSGTIHGTVADPTGAVIPNATVSVTTSDGHTVATVKSNGAGTYEAGPFAPGTYIVLGSAPGFAASSPKAVTLSGNESKSFRVTLPIEAVQQQVQVTSESTTVNTSPDENANAIVIKGKDLDALSDDPDELESELEALAGPAAGPNGGELYIDGFSGGEMPPKSSIREIRINQNPFSAEFDRLGYGRIEIFTKPGTDKLHGQIQSRGNDSAFNSQNPILNSNLRPGETPIVEPPYYSFNVNGSVGGPLTSGSSYFLSVYARRNQDQSIIDAADPANPTETLNQAISNPSSRFHVSPRLDVQLGQSNTLSVRDSFTRAVDTNSGLGALTLPSQAMNSHRLDNSIQLSDSLVLSPTLVADIRFRYRRVRSQNLPTSSAPAVTAQGAFTAGGNTAGRTEDHQDDFELQNYLTQSAGPHSLHYGVRLRAYRDTNYNDQGANGSYIFDTIENYQAGKPKQYTVTLINNPVARATLFDAALFYQDDWRLNPRLTLSYGLRWETQNRIHDKSDWAPRLMLAYALDGGGGAAKTVLRAGYGWFYDRLTVPHGAGGTPYVIRTIHNNFVPAGSSEIPNERGITVANPDFYDPNHTVTSFSGSASAVAPTGYSLDPNFHASLDMQSAIGIDRQLAKNITSNVTYLYSRGVHQYLTNNVSSAGVYPLADALDGTYPAQPVAPPTENNMQYQSGGVYRQNQIIASVNARYNHFSIVSFYTYNSARGDTSGLSYTPTVASNPGLDYGRASFDIHHRFLIMGSIDAPWQFSFSPFFAYNSGRPYNLTTGLDLTGNNQFNARPTFATSCDAANVVSTPYGCLDANPLASPDGANEQIVPYNLGTGPSNVSVNLRVAKVFGFGPDAVGAGGRGGGFHGRGHGLGPGGLGGGGGGFHSMGLTTSRRYNLTLEAYTQNLFNHVNLGPPNGTLSSPFFGRSQSLAGGFFGSSTAGNRSVFLAANFSF
ncbi:MAG TPA: carboxypeptidase regulatory-like domain-containing protein [Acidobacteriaceae bacterium]|nr:carboxypeptidase regulatory-like domain-containing protein [Acidobacteriaceae bacterium]